MRKTITLSVLVILILAGMHFSIALHYCNNSFASSTISLGGKTPLPCCMSKELSGPGTFIVSDCCDDELTVYRVDNHLPPPDAPGKLAVQPLTINFSVANSPAHLNRWFSDTSSKLPSASPPAFLAQICILRI